MIDPSREKADAELARMYQRPTQAWVCGWAASGQACLAGPGPGGSCPARAECVPHREGDRWHCSRTSAGGGACAEGPLPDGRCSTCVPPCQPVRSLRAKRGLLALSGASLSFGLILLVIGSPARRDFLSPGKLTFKHGTVADRCEACHDVAPETFGELFAQVQIPHKDVIQTGLCLNCHDMGEHATAVHGLPTSAIDALTHRNETEQLNRSPLLLAVARRTVAVPRGEEGSLTCGTCHREHQGRQAVVGSMDNQQCQACHREQFASLADGHPQFQNYPYRRRTALYFDHESHIGRHFKESAKLLPEGAAGDSCLMCHRLDRSGQMMVVRDFDESCASCHLSQITDTSLGGVRFYNLPALDMERLTTLKSAIGEWPAQATGEPSAMLTLLLADKADQPLLDQVDLTDLRNAKPSQLDAAGELAWNIKGLLFDLLLDGDQALRNRLERLTNPPLSPEQITLMVADLAPSTARTAQEKWLPGLLQEAPAHRAGQPLPVPAPAVPIFTQPGSVRWRIDDANCSLQYFPRRHTDLFMQSWLDVAGREYAKSPAFARVFDALADPYGAGRCTKCHSVESRPDGSRFVHWRTAQPQSNVHAFTTFVHAPHFSLLGGKRCDICHAPADGSNYAGGFFKPDHTLNLDATGFASNFRPIDKSTCAECHARGRAGDSCLQCHSYHVGTFTANRIPIESFLMPADKGGKPAHP